MTLFHLAWPPACAFTMSFLVMEKLAKAKKLAHKLYNLGLVETSALYDDQADEQLTEAQILDALQKPKDTAYMLETFMQFCDGSQSDKDHEMFFTCHIHSRKIVRPRLKPDTG